MAYQLQYFDETEKDVHEAKTWYKEQKEGLDIEFSTSIANPNSQLLCQNFALQGLLRGQTDA